MLNYVILFNSFLLDLIFIDISSVIPFPGFSPTPETPYHILLLGAPFNPPTPPILPRHSPTLGHQAFTGPRVSLPIDDKAILCYTCSCSHEFLHVYSLVGDSVTGRSEGSGWLVLILLFFSSFSPSPTSSTGVPVFSLMVGCKHPLL